MEPHTARRRVEMIAAHFSAADNVSATAVATHVFPLIQETTDVRLMALEEIPILTNLTAFTSSLPNKEHRNNCSGGLASMKRRCDNSMHFARQESRSQGSFMRPTSTEQDFFDQSSLTSKSTRSQKEGSSELVTPMFSQPASINSNAPKVRNLQHAVSDYMLPYIQPPKFSRTTIEREIPMQISPQNNARSTKGLGFEKKLSPRMDIAESGGKYVLLIELPGISIDDIKVEVDNTTLTVQTSKGRTTASSLNDRTNSSYHKREILEGPFQITWPLPNDVNPDSISAEFLDGLLHITIYKLRVPVW